MKLKRHFLPGLRYSSFIFLVLLFITTVIFWIFFSQEKNSQKQILLSNEQQNIKLLQTIIENDIKMNAYNLIFLANHTKLHKWLTTRQTGHRQELIQLFLNLCKETAIYDQIRFIDQNGMEQIRINFNNGRYTFVPDNELQNKADRYYFKETIKLNLSQISVSPLDLNIEHGKIEYPLKPMIRFGMPVFDFEGRKMGIVLLNYLGDKLIDHLDSIHASSAGTVMLINSDGFYLKAAQPEDEWGFLFTDRKNKKMALTNPIAWGQIANVEEGQFTIDSGLFSYATIRITATGMHSSTGSEQALKPYQNEYSNKGFYWKIVSLVSTHALKESSWIIFLRFLPFYGLIVTIMFFISWWLGHTINLRIRAQETLDQTTVELKSLFRSVPAGIGMVSNRIITQANQQLCKMTGYSQDELLGKSSRILYPTDVEFEDVGRRKYRQIKKKGTGTIETCWRCKNGEIIDVSLSSTPVDLNDFTKGVTFSALNITDRKRAEEELVVSEKRYRIIIETASDGIFTVSEDGKFTSLNTAFETLIGQTREKWIGKTCLDIFCSNDKQSAEQVFQQAFNGKSTVTQEFKIHTDALEHHTICEFKLKPKYNKAGRVVGIVGFVRDRTEYNKAQETVQRVEAQLRQSQKMEAIGTLAGGIAHDFNNILSGIFGYAQLAEMNLDGSEKVKRYIGQIVKGAQRATALVQQILTFSRQKETEKHPIKAYLQVKEALKLLRSSIPSTIEIKETIGTRSMILADPTKIHQIVMNLCTNAYHAMMDKGGILKVSLKDIEISEPKHKGDKNIALGKYLQLQVSDTGHGMDNETLEKAFDPYFTTRRAGEGTGLGLALVNAIVEEHDGFLEVSSTPDKGTNFYIYFPITEQETNHKQIKNDMASVFEGNESIMMVDDEEDIRLCYKMILEGYGYKVHSFQNGIDAFNDFQKNPHQFDLIITDMTMPGMTGIELLQKIHEVREDIPSILCSGFSGLVNDEKAIQMGVSRYLMKPVLKNDLASAIRELIDKKKAS